MPEITNLFEKTGAETRHIYTVSQITQDIKSLLENTFPALWVEGEISNCRPSASGHCYLSLKDENAILQAVLFNRAARDVKFKLEDGLKIICFGNIEVYGPHGKYQLIIEKIEPKGIGSLQLALEQLKKKLEKEGLFSPAHKRPIPYLPARIGVVTSLQGAAVKDILKVLERRFKDIHIIISSVKVQGEGAKEEIAQAIDNFNMYNSAVSAREQIEVLIVGRGGGSIEDLWAFNEEVVARAIYNSRIPVISAVGHERDWTIADLVADHRAPTPSVAAEEVIPKKEDLQEKLFDLIQDLRQSLEEVHTAHRDTVQEMLHRLALSTEHILEMNSRTILENTKKLLLLNPVTKINQFREKLLDIGKQIHVRMTHLLKIRDAEFSRAAQNLASLNPLAILSRGYSVTFKMPGGEIIKDAKTVGKGDTIKTTVEKGEIVSRVIEIK